MTKTKTTEFTLGRYQADMSNFYKGPYSDDNDFLPFPNDLLPKEERRWFYPLPPTFPQKAIGRCPKCGIDISGVMGYVCPNQGCPVFLQATC